MKTRPVRAELFHVDGWSDKHDEDNDGIILVTRGYLVQYFPEVQTSVT
jgi:hypothetical protein